MRINGEIMKIRFILTAALMAMVSAVYFSTPSSAENKTLKAECETKAKQAAELIKSLDAEAAFAKITDPKGSFVGKTSHVFCIDADSGRLLAHKVTRFVGANMHYYMDADGKAPYTNILEKVRQQEKGWITYMSRGSGPDRREVPALKNMHYYKVPGEQIVLCCGYWEDA